METLKIAGVSVRKDKMDALDHDTMINLALKTAKYYKMPTKKAISEIKAELKKHGISKRRKPAPKSD